MGIKGTVRRSTDGHIIHANIDTDVIIAEEPPYGKYNLHFNEKFLPRFLYVFSPLFKLCSPYSPFLDHTI